MGEKEFMDDRLVTQLGVKCCCKDISRACENRFTISLEKRTDARADTSDSWRSDEHRLDGLRPLRTGEGRVDQFTPSIRPVKSRIDERVDLTSVSVPADIEIDLVE